MAFERPLKRFRQSTLQLKARKSTRLRVAAVASLLDLATVKASTAVNKGKQGKTKAGKALTGKKRKAKEVVQETEEERERKRQLRAKADERELERLERERAEVEQHRQHLQHIQAAFDPHHIDIAVAVLASQPDEVDYSDDDDGLDEDEKQLSELQLHREDEDGEAREAELSPLPRLESADSLLSSDESLSSLPPLLSPSCSSSSSSSILSTDSTASLHSSPSPPPVLDFDLTLDWPYLTSHSLFYLLAYSPLPPPSLFHHPGIHPPLPSSVPSFKPITRNLWRGKQRAPTRKAKAGHDEEGDGRCGCRSKARVVEDAEAREARGRAERKEAGCVTAEDVRREEEEEARKRATMDSGYLAKPAAVTSFNCSDGCLNALLLVECDDSNCSTGSALCRNRHFTRKEEPPLVEPFPTELKGWGLRAKADLPADRFLVEYVGEVINNAECRRRIEKEDERVRRQVEKLRKAAMKQRGKGGLRKKGRGGNAGGVEGGGGGGEVEGEGVDGQGVVGGPVSVESNYYFMSVSDDVIIDAGTKGSVARFINHSCDANCLIAKWTVQGEVRIAIFTQRAVRRGEELTIDYKYDRIGLEYQACFCGADNCAKWIGGKKRKVERGRGGEVGEGEEGGKGEVGQGKQKGTKGLGKKKKRLTQGTLKRMAFNQADDVCAVCGGAGEVIMCDGKVTGTVFCPRVFHAECVAMEAAPKGGWTCPWHFCKTVKGGMGGGEGGEGKEGEGVEEGEVCGRKAAQFCVGCSASRCARCREEEGDLGVRWRDSRVYRTGAMEEQGREWLAEEGAPEWRWVLCVECEQRPAVMRESEEQLWDHRMGTAPPAAAPLTQPPPPPPPAHSLALPLLPKIAMPLPLLPRMAWHELRAIVV